MLISFGYSLSEERMNKSRIALKVCVFLVATAIVVASAHDQSWCIYMKHISTQTRLFQPHALPHVTDSAKQYSVLLEL